MDETSESQAAPDPLAPYSARILGSAYCEPVAANRAVDRDHSPVMPLVFHGHCWHLPDTMPRWSSRQMIALFLGLFVGLSLSLSAVQASIMTAKMASSSDKMASVSEMVSSGHGDCNGCGGDQSTTKAMPCASFCVPSVFAIGVPLTASMAAPMTVMARIMTADVFLAGKTPPPDPYPPRSIDLF